MAKKLFVQLDLDLIRRNLGREDGGREVSEAQVRAWLVDAGFEPWGEGWLVNEPDLGQVEPSEVIWIEDFECN
jgi:hypothetical protein